MTIRHIIASHTLAAGLLLTSSTALMAQDVSYTLYGTPGLIEMPTARSEADAGLAFSLTGFGFQQRANFSFQVTSRLSGTFRYSGIQDQSGPGTDSDTFDRSFDLRYRILDETETRPAVAIGLQDFLGTGKLSSEYIVATKGFGTSLDVTAGIGWGRFGSRNGFTNPLNAVSSYFTTRPSPDYGLGGEIESDQLFRGDAAFFGGLEYAYSDQLRLKAEYSSDAYSRETTVGTLNNLTPVNIGLSYQYRPDLALSLALLHGSEIAAGATVTLNPRQRPFIGGVETAPTPVRVRPEDAQAAASWGTSEEQLTAALATAGVTLNAYDVRADTVARVRYTNTTYRSEAQAMGRVARILSAHLPAAVETLVLEPQQQGIPLASATLNRRDLETLEHQPAGAETLLERSTLADASSSTEGYTIVPTDTSAFTWGLGPYSKLIVFNGNDPVQVDVGLDLALRYELAPNMVIQGSARQSALGARDLADEFQADNDYHNVRTDGRLYGRGGTPTLETLTFAHYGRPGENLYSRVSLGYLEKMYGGVSGEVLWKPVGTDYAFGAELNYVKQRDFDQLFGFQDYDTLTGHLSGYYSFANGFHTQVDVGRYLAGDWGASFSLDREFANGWKVGAYFTLTDMPFEQYGEGSFDKGIRISVPTDFFLGTASRNNRATSLSSLSRDGGARVNVDGRLYDTVRSAHQGGNLGDTWGRFWR